MPRPAASGVGASGTAVSWVAATWPSPPAELGSAVEIKIEGVLVAEISVASFNAARAHSVDVPRPAASRVGASSGDAARAHGVDVPQPAASGVDASGTAVSWVAANWPSSPVELGSAIASFRALLTPLRPQTS